jgi:SAM-dependent methyltransferase
MDPKKKEWSDSYRNKDNFVFYPHEEVIRFVSKYIRKRTGLNEYRDVVPCDPPPTVLDLGCGIGRHVVYCHQMGLDAYGIDLSEAAVAVARSWSAEHGIENPEKRILQGDVRNLPWPDSFFKVAVSHGVLDSMHLEIARAACKELARTLAHGGLLYCDLISGDDSSHAREYCGEDIVSTRHEKGTIQSYFNFLKLKELFDGMFDIEEALLIRRENVLDRGYSSRYHLVLKKH